MLKSDVKHQPTYDVTVTDTIKHSFLSSLMEFKAMILLSMFMVLNHCNFVGTKRARRPGVGTGSCPR